MRRLALLALAPIAALCLPSAAMAHPRLVSAEPAASATATKVSQLKLTFSESLVAPLSGVKLTMTAMPGMSNHKPMAITGFTVQTDGPVMTVKLPRQLPAGTYLLEWHVVAADQHRIEGRYSFTVR